MTARRPAPPPPGITRRELLRLGGTVLGGLALSGLSLPGCGDEGDSGRFRFAVLADPHIIDSFYQGPEGSPEDTESIVHTRERLEAARAVVNAIRPPVERVFIAGDVAHNYPSTDWDFYFQNETRFDIARTLLDGFAMPVHIGLGNHDYDIGTLPRDFTHDLFREKFGIEPYYSVEHGGCVFVHLNNFLGTTCEPGHADYNPDVGSFGATQLDWLEAELQRGLPSFLFLHFPLASVRRDEEGGRDLFTVLAAHRETIQRVIAGHWHIWMDFEESYGPPHLLCASTRYDEDAFLVVEADPRAATHRILNWDQLSWLTHDTEPWAAAARADLVRGAAATARPRRSASPWRRRVRQAG